MVNQMNAEQTKAQDNNVSDEVAEGEADEVTIYSSHYSMSDGKNVVELSINLSPQVLYVIFLFLSYLLMKNLMCVCV